MTCASCAAGVEKFIASKKGINTVAVNLATETGIFEFDPAFLSENDIIRSINSLGYKAEKTDGISAYSLSSTSQSDDVKKLFKRFIASLILALPVLYLAMSPMAGLYVPRINPLFNAIFQFAVTTAIMAVNWNIYASGVKKLLMRNPNMDSLVEIGTLAAYFYSVAISLHSLTDSGKHMNHLYFESAAFILVFISLGKYLESLAKKKTHDAVRKLVDLQPKKAFIEKDGVEIEIDTSSIKPGDIVVVRPGTTIPIDGETVFGSSYVDEKAITGESVPTEINIGDKVIGGTVNLNGFIKFTATKSSSETVLAQIIKTVYQALNTKAPVQLLADRISFYFVPAVLTIAVVSFAVWMILGKPFVFALTSFVSILIIACPCSLGLATPTAVMMGMGLAAKRNILIKKSEALEEAFKVEEIVFDKTGTLTEGRITLSGIALLGDFSEQEILSYALSLESKSEHPVAKALTNHAVEKNAVFKEVEKIAISPGKGIGGVIDGFDILIGTPKFHKLSGTDITGIREMLDSAGNETVVLLSVSGIPASIFTFSDPVREEAAEVVKKIKDRGIRVSMITGDSFKVASSIAEKTGIENVLAEVLPNEKSEKIEEIKRSGKKIAMVGDGINDAPALATADIGIALGSGTDIAIETGDIILVKDDLKDVITALDISKFTMQKIKQNLFWAFFYNLLGIPLAAGAFYWLTGWLLNPVFAALAMSFSSVSVVMNSLSMKFYKGRF